MPLADVVLTLGPVAFRAFEAPETIGFGGEQRLAVHDMPGGGRVIDAIGPVPAEITWHGIFAGPDATFRARLLDTLRLQGQPLPLSWDVFFYSVVVHHFEANYHNHAWVPYTIGVTVLPVFGLGLGGVLDTLVADITGDGAAASGFAATAGLSLGTLQTALAAPNACVGGSANYVAAVTGTAAAQTNVSVAMAAAEANLGTYASAGVSSAAAVGGMILAAGTDAALASSGAYLGRVAANLANAGS